MRRLARARAVPPDAGAAGEARGGRGLQVTVGVVGGRVGKSAFGYVAVSVSISIYVSGLKNLYKQLRF